MRLDFVLSAVDLHWRLYAEKRLNQTYAKTPRRISGGVGTHGGPVPGAQGKRRASGNSRFIFVFPCLGVSVPITLISLRTGDMLFCLPLFPYHVELGGALTRDLVNN